MFREVLEEVSAEMEGKPTAVMTRALTPWERVCPVRSRAGLVTGDQLAEKLRRLLHLPAPQAGLHRAVAGAA